MDELERLTKRVEALESLVNALLSGDERVIHLSNVPIANVVLGKGCQVTMHNCPQGTVFFGDQDALEEAASRLDDLASQADDLDSALDDIESRLDDLRDQLDDFDGQDDDRE